MASSGRRALHLIAGHKIKQVGTHTWHRHGCLQLDIRLCRLPTSVICGCQSRLLSKQLPITLCFALSKVLYISYQAVAAGSEEKSAHVDGCTCCLRSAILTFQTQR